MRESSTYPSFHLTRLFAFSTTGVSPRSPVMYMMLLSFIPGYFFRVRFCWTDLFTKQTNEWILINVILGSVHVPVNHLSSNLGLRPGIPPCRLAWYAARSALRIVLTLVLVWYHSFNHSIPNHVHLEVSIFLSLLFPRLCSSARTSPCGSRHVVWSTWNLITLIVVAVTKIPFYPPWEYIKYLFVPSWRCFEGRHGGATNVHMEVDISLRHDGMSNRSTSF